MKARALAAKVLADVMSSGQSLTRVIASRSKELTDPSEQALLQEISYGVLRWWLLLDAISKRLLSKPLKTKDSDIRNVLLIGLYQLAYMRIPDHAVISETVKACVQLKKPWAKSLVNAVLRSYQRQAADISDRVKCNDTVVYAHPNWLLECIKTAWPAQWRQIVGANNARPPMVLRVNERKIDRDSYLQMLNNNDIAATVLNLTAQAVVLETPLPVSKLPGFNEGLVSVQDAAAQLAASLLNPQVGDYLLDVCAAPGGKTAHLLETQPALAELVALDIDPLRLVRISENLTRLGLKATLKQVDASCSASLMEHGNGAAVRLFDRVLVDAPCSASGVIRRHPDIKWLRRLEDIEQLVDIQLQILHAVWPLLAPGGVLLYATCSVLPAENTNQIKTFLSAHVDAEHLSINADWGQACEYGRQLLPGDIDTDGFYYACLKKH
ncbi:MAG: 16S rRNA (cytosine(967)-C(5))-methyltransferase RsmB [Gammaproteobacteria bacterium]|nr:16S rRNA (cytosine(967)-C(5))-methyltransferase RsmB [Gammaproteobacteria bacterium]